MLASKNKNKMRKFKNRLLKQLVDLLERELLAVMAVAIVLAFIFSQSLAVTSDRSTTLISSETGTIVTQQGAETIFSGKSIIYFGRNVKGPGAPGESWTGDAINLGTSIYAPGPASVTIGNVTAGSYRLSVVGSGTVKVNGATFNLGNAQTSVSNSVTIGADGKLTVLFSAGAEVFNINTGSSVGSTGETTIVTQTPAILSLIPGGVNVNLQVGSTLSPVAVVQDGAGKVMATPPLTWSSSNTKIATVSADGAITALAEGTATITAKVTSGTLKASLSITVPAAVEEAPPIIEITPKTTEEGEAALDEFAGEITNDLVGPLIGSEGTGTEPVGESGVVSYPGADEGRPSTGGTIQEVLDAYAVKQAEIFSDTGATTLGQKEISEVINQTQTTALSRFTATVQLGIRDVTKGLKEIVAGSKETIITLSGETVEVRKPSAAQIIGSFIARLFGIGESGASATPLSAGSGSGSGSGEDLN
ncbi:hypothetical protein A2V68_01335 [candidate division Kazan bacterium RBG_13_50_9]|uniref:BIG2 domain-containing protein n=1 Tax=candidate division Kazan bacterium RBG_13_50_9 TaxID=1798535 RepID=A0A1F4NSH5_UNCK3|nr:MAG: hypothetical protein A2V68_01335 [candidate division Kazan bacterium RBG_13_50_9]